MALNDFNYYKLKLRLTDGRVGYWVGDEGPNMRLQSNKFLHCISYNTREEALEEGRRLYRDKNNNIESFFAEPMYDL